MPSENGYREFPYEIVDVDDETFSKVYALIQETAEKNSVRVGPKKYWLPEIYKKCHSDIYNLKARPDDILLVGFPRTGTTLHSEMVWQIANNLDFQTAKDVILVHRFPVIDLCLTMGDLKMLGIIADNVNVADDVRNIAKRYDSVSVKKLVNFKGRRLLRAHLPISLLSPSFFESGCKVIYCARNPKDLVVSFYHIVKFFRPKESGTMSFPSFFRAFRNNWTIYTSYFNHVKEAWDKRNDENFLFVFYEDTVKDLRRAVVRMADFLGNQLSDEQQKRLVDYLGIDKFKTNKSVNCDHMRDLGMAGNDVEFIRNGGSGGWRKFFVGDLETEVNEWIAENLKDTDLVFPED